ncbi:flagellar basal body-associated FliL family protein [Kitasatospora acidiphila]|uniref:DUF2613 family protein n=1 Tax=Kitasatospora acidiphila TaxID=2567942 RepID=UPI0015F02EAC|nr:DUF2613 family protein [Kitasatospora acidiphila]
MNKIVAAVVGAACGLALVIGGAAWASDSGRPTAPAQAGLSDAVPPGGNTGSCC